MRISDLKIGDKLTMKPRSQVIQYFVSLRRGSAQVIERDFEFFLSDFEKQDKNITYLGMNGWGTASFSRLEGGHWGDGFNFKPEDAENMFDLSKTHKIVLNTRKMY